MSMQIFRERAERLRKNIVSVIHGKDEVVELCLAALFARGHLLLEDVPGVGKTTLASTIASSIHCSFQRIQFTSDMLPSDILGVTIFDQDKREFEFRQGPLFANVVLADEINRATPRTQSALLEAMAEGQVTVDGKTHALPAPFFVIATQNPTDLVGTYPLPDSQLDRFLLRTRLGYPSAEEERQLLIQRDRRDLLAEMKPILDPARLAELIAIARNVHLSEPVLDYIQALVEGSRNHAAVVNGLSPRAALALAQSARAHALIQGQDFCLPDNVRTVFPALAGHRLQTLPESGIGGDAVVQEIIDATAVA